MKYLTVTQIRATIKKLSKKAVKPVKGNYVMLSHPQNKYAQWMFIEKQKLVLGIRRNKNERP